MPTAPKSPKPPKAPKRKPPTPEAVRRALVALLDAVRTHRPGATADSIAAALFTRNRRTVNRWISGESPRLPIEARRRVLALEGRLPEALTLYDTATAVEVAHAALARIGAGR